MVDVPAYTNDADFMMLLNAVERLVLLSLSQSVDAAQLDDDNVFSDKPTHDGSGILGYVSNVFSADGTSAPPEEGTSVCVSLIIALRITYARPDQGTGLSLSSRVHRGALRHLGAACHSSGCALGVPGRVA